MKVGITGHRTLPNADSWAWVNIELREQLNLFTPPLLGISSLAIGADQIFAEAVLELGGGLEVILPFADYQRTFLNDPDIRAFQTLLQRAQRVITIPPAASDEEAFWQAGLKVVEHCDCLLAVWDSQPARGPGGTATIVNYAASVQKPVVELNPINRTVTTINYGII